VILLKDCFAVAVPADAGAIGTQGRSHDAGADGANSRRRFSLVRGVDILLDGNRIAKIAPNIEAPEGATVIDASRHVVVPGLVNTHHHFYQTLTRNLPAVQDAKLFDWLVYLYEIWNTSTPRRCTGRACLRWPSSPRPAVR
jgi:Cytosine deaminase and related metal-dependent hydrolases